MKRLTQYAAMAIALLLPAMSFAKDQITDVPGMAAESEDATSTEAAYFARRLHKADKAEREAIIAEFVKNCQQQTDSLKEEVDRWHNKADSIDSAGERLRILTSEKTEAFSKLDSMKISADVVPLALKQHYATMMEIVRLCTMIDDITKEADTLGNELNYAPEKVRDNISDKIDIFYDEYSKVFTGDSNLVTLSDAQLQFAKGYLVGKYQDLLNKYFDEQ